MFGLQKYIYHAIGYMSVKEVGFHVCMIVLKKVLLKPPENI